MSQPDNHRRMTRRDALRASAGAVAGLAVAGTAAGQEQIPDYGDWFTSSAPGATVENYDGTTADMRDQDSVTVEVGAEGNGGPYAFEPPAVWISPGTTVNFEWTSDTHNVIVEEQPSGAGWEGHETIENTGFSFSHTFETGGIYKYYCQPHLSLGMKGAIVVGDDVPMTAPDAGGEGGEAAGQPIAPGGELGLLFVAAGLATAGLAAVAVLFGEFYGSVRGPGAVAELEAGTEETEPEEPVREIGHDEFDPTGTASLIVVYLLILVVMWVFMYFVEFLGRGPTVIG